MATFKTKVNSTSTLVSTYRDKVVVFLEGATDVALFANQWFIDKLDRLDFREPESSCGCNGVVKDVALKRAASIKAFGIVDRDKLQADKHWDLVWETDDETFSSARPYGEHVRVTRFWEVESYLVEPDIVEHHVALKQGGRLERASVEVAAECLAHAEVLIPHAALNGALRDQGIAEWHDGATSAYADRAAFESHLLACRDSGNIGCLIWNGYQANVPKVEAFGDGSEPAERLRGLLRRVNGKALIHRIKKMAKLHDDPTFYLAAAIRQRGAIPSELTLYVTEFAQA